MKLRRPIEATFGWLRRTWPWDVLVRACTSVGITLENLGLLESISRPWWLYRAGGRLPATRIERSSQRPVTAEDIALCERLVAAFAASTDSDRLAGEPAGIWGWIRDAHQRQLEGALVRRDAEGLARLLASMFQEEFMWGLLGDASANHRHTRLGHRILALKSLDILVSLAEAVGVVPVENPGQGQAGRAFESGLAKLVEKVDAAVGFRIDFPRIGTPHGLMVDGRLITLDTPEQIYAALRLDQARWDYLRSSPESSLRIVEIGGGYGAMCYWFLRIRPGVDCYTIVDLPTTNVIQGYFLAKALGATNVSFYGERPALVRISPNSALLELDTPCDILVNKDSMPEMPHAAMASYIEWGRANCDGLFYSYNQEARAPFPLVGGTQGVVSEAIERVGGFERKRRDHSWLRRGYVEEIYTPLSRRQPTVRRARTADGAPRQADRAPR
jgi:hypothetical protein